MDALGAYRSDSEDSGAEEESPLPVASVAKPGEPQSAAKVVSATVPAAALGRRQRMQSAPDVAGAGPAEAELQAALVDPRVSTLFYNPRAEELWAPVAGPALPGQPGVVMQGLQNAHTGFVEQAAIDEHAFNQQYVGFNTFGCKKAVAGQKTSTASSASTSGSGPASGSGSSGSSGSSGQTPTISASDILTTPVGLYQPVEPSEARLADREELRRKRKAGADDARNLEAYEGPWARPRELVIPGPEDLTPEQLEYIRAREEKLKTKRRKTASQAAPGKDEDGKEADGESADADSEDTGAPEETQWLGAVPEDQLREFHHGRSFVEPPPDTPRNADPLDQTNKVPQKLVHTYAKAHSKAVVSIQLIPKSGHLLLSAGMDGMAKLWDTRQGQRRLLRTYSGHGEQPLRTADFLYDGTQFLTASHDRWIKVWDTETGKCISRHTTRAKPLCAKFHPEADEAHGILVGQDNRKIVQWDTRANEVVQVYDEHLKAVNSITFIDDNRKFMSTSDDLKALIWEYGIPVVAKHISDPSMHSMPAVTLHPSGKYVACQSLDNQILAYTARNRFKLNRKKVFRGHQNAGFAIQPGFSANGKYLMSGDGSGKLYVWDWGRGNVVGKWQAHDSVTIASLWHPWETSTVFTAGWDGLIKVWK